VALAAAVVPVAGQRIADAQECTIAVVDDSHSTAQDTALVVDPIGVVANDTICGTDGLVISTSSPTHGTLTDFDDNDGRFTYTPNPGFTGTDSFTYALEDVEGSPTATVTITVGAAAPTTASSTTSTTAASTTSTARPSSSNGAVQAVQAVQATPAFTG
jgi:hypothetical protein